MQNLPITQVIPEIREKLSRHTRVVLQAPPGAGKTTALPLALLDAPWLEGKKIVMLEPRRLAVRASASRMAEQLGEKVGERIGYQVKMESIQSSRTRILIVTEGILTRKLQNDPSLEDVGLIIFDEFHERSIHADLALALALESQSILREDIRILVMSATLHTTAISELLGGAPVIESEGRSYPVTRRYLPLSVPQPDKRSRPDHIHRLLLRLLDEEEGNILVFLPGIREIGRVASLLASTPRDALTVSPLYGNLSKADQEQAIAPPPAGTRKIVLSTNIAQTSLTIEGIGVVVDSGLENVSIFSPFSGMDRLETVFISEDTATQRAGRAGRLSAGVAYHLWHPSRILAPHDTPEILRADLAPMLLELSAWGCRDLATLSWMDIPPSASLSHASELLRQLGALDSEGRITPHGEAMSRYPMHPRLAHMMLRAGELGLTYEASLLAVLITEKDIYTRVVRDADLRERVSLLHEVRCGDIPQSSHIDIVQCRYLLKNAARIEPKQKQKIDTEMLGVLLAFAYPDRIAKLANAQQNAYRLSGGKGAKLHPDDPLARSGFLVVADLDAGQSGAAIYKALPITHPLIEEYLAEQIEVCEDVSWNDEQQRVEAREIHRLGAIILREQQAASVPPERVTEALLEALGELGAESLPWSKEARRLRERVGFLALHGIDLPDLSAAYLDTRMEEWLAPYLTGITTLKACQSLDLHAILRGRLSYPQTQTLDRLAPDRIKVASGSHIAIDYSDPAQPILAVRLQEMFGTRTTPTLLDGKVRLMLHLLSPASRPMQMTQDIESFWRNTYDEVKKELRGKYSKHYWPDDPLAAVATSKTKKYMQG